MTKSEQLRLWAWRVRVIREGASSPRNIAPTCRRFGISRQAFYRWKRRFDAQGDAGLWDRSSRPNRSPTATPREVVSKILYLRQHYHFGPGKIADYLRRFHQQSLAVSSVHRILLRHGMNRLPANQKHLGPVVGRKNHYGSRSLRGTAVAAACYTLCETARLVGVDPRAYLLRAVYAAIGRPGTVTFPEDLLASTLTG
jgi:transposase-like protein